MAAGATGTTSCLQAMLVVLFWLVARSGVEVGRCPGLTSLSLVAVLSNFSTLGDLEGVLLTDFEISQRGHVDARRPYRT
jgi:hypothetical protein